MILLLKIHRLFIKKPYEIQNNLDIKNKWICTKETSEDNFTEITNSPQMRLNGQTLITQLSAHNCVFALKPIQITIQPYF